MALCLLLVPWAYEGVKNDTNMIWKLKNFRNEKIRIIVTGALLLPILVAITIVIINNIQDWIEERRIETEGQMERERQEAIEEEKRNTPKPVIKVLSIFDKVLSGTTAIVDFEVSDATEVYLQDNLIAISEIWQYTEKIDLYSKKMTIHIKAKNKYWETEEGIEIVREKTAKEIEAERVIEEERLEAEKQAKIKEERRFIDGLGISRYNFEKHFSKTFKWSFVLLDQREDEHWKVKQLKSMSPFILVEWIGPDDNLYNVNISTSSQEYWLLAIMIFAAYVDESLDSDKWIKFIGGLLDKAKANDWTATKIRWNKAITAGYWDMWSPEASIVTFGIEPRGY